MPNNELIQIGQNIKRLRLRKGLTQKQLAKRAGVSISYLGRIERGRVNVSIWVVWKIAGGLGVSVGEVLHEYKPREPA